MTHRQRARQIQRRRWHAKQRKPRQGVVYRMWPSAGRSSDPWPKVQALVAEADRAARRWAGLVMASC